MELKDRIIVAIDEPRDVVVDWMISHLAPLVGGFKLGSIAISAGYAHRYIEKIKKLRKIVFWDNKFNEIPNTMAGSVEAVALQGVDWISVHASAGEEALKRAVRSRIRSSILGVTVLTSMETRECLETFGDLLEDKILQFAYKLLEVKAQGIVASPRDLKLLSGDSAFNYMLKVAVAVRSSWASLDDQKRFATPREAILAGADYLVIGRPITHPPDCTPEVAVERIVDEMASVGL